MKTVPRCRICKARYKDGTGVYHLPLQSMFIRKRNGKIVWIKVGYYCKNCKRFYTLDVEKKP